ncbi:dTMP kinase [bacterium]|nr:dTMP kinase [bacterium]
MVEISKSGILISFEGIEGCGKSTQITMLAERLRSLGREVVVSREPGATPLGKQLRDLLLNPTNNPDALTELLLYLADRREHCRRVISPALARGAIILLDRFIDSTWVYQGYAAAAAGANGERESVSVEIIDSLNRLVLGSVWPKLTFLLDCPAETGLNRARRRNHDAGEVGIADRFEQRHLDFHEQVQAGFLHLAEVECERFCVVDAKKMIDDIHNDIWHQFSNRILGPNFRAVTSG